MMAATKTLVWRGSADAADRKPNAQEGIALDRFLYLASCDWNFTRGKEWGVSYEQIDDFLNKYYHAGFVAHIIREGMPNKYCSGLARSILFCLTNL